MGHPLQDSDDEQLDESGDDDFGDDEGLDLPPLGDTGAAEEDADEAGLIDAEDAAELEVGEGESVGLDDEEVGETFDVTELIDADGEDGESGWTKNTEEAGDIAGDALEGYAGGQEYGYTEGTEAPSIDEWEDGVAGEGIGPEQADDAESVLGDDAGEEGIDDHFVSQGGDDDDDDFPGLPPLDAGLEEGPDEEASELDLQEDARIDVPERTFEQEARLMGEALPEPLPQDARELAHLGPDDEAVYAISIDAESGEVLAGASTLWAAAPDGASAPRLEDLQPSGLAGRDATSIATDRRDPACIAVGTRLDGVLVSDDGGRTFDFANDWTREESTVACFVAADSGDGATRLWMRTRAGALHRSDDFGRRWVGPVLTSPVAAMAADPQGGLLALGVPRRGPAQLTRTEDGGRSWMQLEVPALRTAREPADEGTFVLAARGPAVAVARDDGDAVYVTLDGGARWARLESLPHAGALALAREDDAMVLYAALYFEGSDRGVVVRHPLAGPQPAREAAEQGPDALVLDVRAERRARGLPERGDPDGDNRVLALEARARSGATELYAATGAGLFRVTIRRGGRGT